MPKLTKRFLETIVPTTKPVFLWDDDLTGFGLKVSPGGAMSWIVQYRTAENRERRMTLGRSTAVTPDEARRHAREVIGEVAKGNDPAAEKLSTRRGTDMNSLFDRYIEEHARQHLAPRTLREAERLIDRHLRPAIGTLKVDGLSSDDVARLHNAMRETPVQANRAVRRLSAILTIAVRWRMRPAGVNPCAGLKQFKEAPRERFMSRDEAGRVLEALATAETTGVPWLVDEAGPKAKHLAKPENRVTVVDPMIVAALRLLLFTGARLTEVLELEWSHIDFKHRTISLPHQKGKARVSQPANAAAIEVLEALPRLAGVRWVLPRANDPSRRISAEVVENAWQRIRVHAGVPDVRIHDLRHTVGTWAGESGANAFQIRDLLRHSTLAMTGRYVNRSDAALRDLTNIIGAQMGAARDRQSPAPAPSFPEISTPSNVVPIPSAPKPARPRGRPKKSG